MFGIGMLRGRRHWLWLAVLAVKSVSTSCSSTDAQVNLPPPSRQQSVSQQPQPPASQLPWRRAWQLPQHSRSRTRAAAVAVAVAPAWVTAPPDEQYHNWNVVWWSVCVSACRFALIVSCTFTQASGTDEHVDRCCTPEVRWDLIGCVCVCHGWKHSLVIIMGTFSLLERFNQNKK